MKELILLTDFTANSEHAAYMAVRLCQKLNTDLLLHNSVQYIPLIPDHSYQPYVIETAEMLLKESKEKLAKTAEALRRETFETSDNHPKILCLSMEGSLGNNIKELTAFRNVSMLVMGGRSGGTINHLLMGSETSAVIRQTSKPVLIIPKKTDLTNLKKIVFATNFSKTDIAAIQYLVEMANQIDLQIEVVHVYRPGHEIDLIEAEVTFRDYLDELNQQRVCYRYLFGEHTLRRLQDFCKQTNAAVLAMTRSPHNGILTMFGHSETNEAIKQNELAVLIFP